MELLTDSEYCEVLTRPRNVTLNDCVRTHLQLCMRYVMCYLQFGLYLTIMGFFWGLFFCDQNIAITLLLYNFVLICLVLSKNVTKMC